MKHFLKSFCILIIAFCTTAPLRAADEKPANSPFAQPQVTLNEDQKKAAELLEGAKKKVDALMQERNALVQQGAAPEQVQAKSAEIMQAQKDAIDTLRKNFPQGLPPIPGMTAPKGPPKLSPADQAELDSLIAQRKQMVMNGAKFEEVQPITEQIQEKYYGRKMTSPPSPNLAKPATESSQTKPT